jgi:RHS repeat-associated protein
VVRTLIYLHGDHLGSISVASSSSGALVSQQEFDPWGKVRSGGVSETKLNYTGQRLDSTGLLYYGARFYDAGLARFISPDDVAIDPGDPQKGNRYSYVLNNPLLHVDPSGNVAQTPPPLKGPNKDVGDYNWMLSYAHSRMTSIVSGNDPTFNAIRAALTVSNTARFLGHKGSPIEVAARGTANALFGAQVCGGCAWDLKQDYQEAYGVSTGGVQGIGGSNMYFSLGGASDDDIAFSIFGNIMFGYVGAAAGFGLDELLSAAAREDFAADPKGTNLPDQAAVLLGIMLWHEYGADMTLEELDEAIRRLAKSKLIHTRKTIDNGFWCGPGVAASVSEECVGKSIPYSVP